MFSNFTSASYLAWFSFRRSQRTFVLFNVWLIFALLFTYGCDSTISQPKDSLDALYPSANTVVKYHNNEWSRNNYVNRIQVFKNDPLKFGEIVFVGNSLTEQGGDWRVKFGLNGIRNRGIAGDVTDGVLKRLEEIIYYKPKAVFLLIGVNDIFNLQGGGGITSADYIANNILNIAKKIKHGSPSTRVYVQTILPSTADLKINTHRINEMIKSNELSGSYTTVDLHSAFANNQGLMRQELTTDGLHLNDRGYKVWTDFIDSFVRL